MMDAREKMIEPVRAALRSLNAALDQASTDGIKINIFATSLGGKPNSRFMISSHEWIDGHKDPEDTWCGDHPAGIDWRSPF